MQSRKEQQNLKSVLKMQVVSLDFLRVRCLISGTKRCMEMSWQQELSAKWPVTGRSRKAAELEQSMRSKKRKGKEKEIAAAQDADGLLLW